MKKSKFIRIIMFLIIVTAVLMLQSQSMAQMNNMSAGSTLTSAEFKTAMRKLWEDHIVWTRNVILNIIDGLDGTDKAVERLLKNQDDIGNAVKPFYGDDGGKKLTELLYSHITIAADLLKAAKAGDDKAFKEANKKWYDNADEIAAFLSSANPNWPKKDMTDMMHSHLELTTAEAVARLKKDFAGDIAAYDKVHDEILSMSDMLAEGIVKQFPEKFTK